VLRTHPTPAPVSRVPLDHRFCDECVTEGKKRNKHRLSPNTRGWGCSTKKQVVTDDPSLVIGRSVASKKNSSYHKQRVSFCRITEEFSGVETQRRLQLPASPQDDQVVAVSIYGILDVPHIPSITKALFFGGSVDRLPRFLCQSQMECHSAPSAEPLQIHLELRSAASALQLLQQGRSLNEG